MPSRLDVRFGAYFASSFLVLGMVLPFLPVWLQSRGFSDAAIGAVLAGAYFGRALVAPAAGLAVDRGRDAARLITVLAFACSIAFLLLGVVSAPAFLALFAVLGFWAFGATMPLSDAAALKLDQSDAMNYGRVRAVGSAAFILANIAGGALIDAAGPETVRYWITGAAILSVVCAYLLPRGTGPAKHGMTIRAMLAELRKTLISRAFVLIFIAASLIQASHAIYYAFSAIEWGKQGLSGGAIGALWGLAILAEIVFFARAKAIVARIGPGGLIVVGGVAAIIRWIALAFAPPALLLVPLQLLHAASFGATHIGTIYFVRRFAPASTVTTVLSATATLIIGPIAALAALAAGPLYHVMAVTAFAVMALLAAAGLVAAYALRRAQPAGFGPAMLSE